MSSNSIDALIAGAIETIITGYRSYRSYFQEITSRAFDRFVAGDWDGMQADAAERLDAYQGILQQVVDDLDRMLATQRAEATFWCDAKTAAAPRIADMSDPDLAETFYNSVVRRLGNIVGADPEREFLVEDPRPLPLPKEGRDYTTFPGRDLPLTALIRNLLESSPFAPHLRDIREDAQRVAQRLSECQTYVRSPHTIHHVEMLVAPFFRGMGAYLIGRVLTRNGDAHPLALALINEGGRIGIDGVVHDSRGIRLLFSFTHSYFHVSTEHVPELIALLRPLLPHRRLAELYISLGFNRHGKTELYRDLARHQNACRDIFDISPGKPGMVMAVFNMPSDDLVFKIIRDRFDQPKRTTRQDVIAKYDYIFRHDRTGRLPDTQLFERLIFDRGCFHPNLLRTLAETTARTVTINAHEVTIELAYVERRVLPLDLYLADARPEEARQAVIDFGQAIKDLACSNIFPGDMLLKNFGVTGLGRVIFYDFDEVCPMTQCRFRRKPPARSEEDELASEPWYYVGENDIFPEEFENFLGLDEALKQVFLTHHRDLLSVEFWQRIQENIQTGKLIHVFPYTRLQTPPPDAA